MLRWQIQSHKFFSAHQIIKATNNFSDSNRISELKDRASKWYSGKIENHPMIFFMHDILGYKLKHYCRDIAISSMVSGHNNFLKLLGCCLEFEKPVIVYSFIKITGFDIEEMVVPWRRRIKIVEDIATALAYLHTAFPRPFVYRIMSLSSILLDEYGVARLCDFSHCISIPHGETFVKVDEIVGTFGFVDHKYLGAATVSEKTDVFAIGVLMQKLLTAEVRFRKACNKHQEKTRKEDDDSEIMSEIGKDEITDPKRLEKMTQVGEEELCPMKAFLMLSMRCVGLKEEVPNMVQVAKELKKIQRSIKHASSPFGETKIESIQDISSSVLPHQSLNTKA